MDRQEAGNETAVRQPRINRPDRSQADPNPKSIDDLIPHDHSARLVWELVQELDMTPLHQEIKAVEGHPGRPAIDPRILVSLWIYATIEGIASARRLAVLCYRDDVFKWLRGGVDVNYHTLSDFRTAHNEWLEDQVIEVVAVLLNEGLINLNQVGQDGMRVRASAGSGSFKREEKLEEFLQQAQQQWERLEEEFEASPEELSAGERAAQKRAADERVKRLQRGPTVYTPVKEAKKKSQRGKDPFVPQRGDSPNVAQWRTRMGTEEAKEKYKQRVKCEFPNAVCRNHGLQQFLVRGLPKVKAVALWHALVYNLLRLVALRAERAAAVA